jgi:hypothetical protein
MFKIVNPESDFNIFLCNVSKFLFHYTVEDILHSHSQLYMFMVIKLLRMNFDVWKVGVISGWILDTNLKHVISFSLSCQVIEIIRMYVCTAVSVHEARQGNETHNFYFHEKHFF